MVKCIGCKAVELKDVVVCTACEKKGDTHVSVAIAVSDARVKCLTCARTMTPTKLGETHGYCRFCRTVAAKATTPQPQSSLQSAQSVALPPQSTAVQSALPTARQPKKREKINSALRYQIWITYASDTMLHSTCYCCVGPMSFISFHCGHIIADAEGGHADVENLRPVCASCNLSMGKENMRKFVERCKFRGRFSEEKHVDDNRRVAIARQLTADGIDAATMRVASDLPVRSASASGDFVIVDDDISSDEDVDPRSPDRLGSVLGRLSIDTSKPVRDSGPGWWLRRWLMCSAN